MVTSHPYQFPSFPSITFTNSPQKLYQGFPIHQSTTWPSSQKQPHSLSSCLQFHNSLQFLETTQPPLISTILKLSFLSSKIYFLHFFFITYLSFLLNLAKELSSNLLVLYPVFFLPSLVCVHVQRGDNHFHVEDQVFRHGQGLVCVFPYLAAHVYQQNEVGTVVVPEINRKCQKSLVIHPTMRTETVSCLQKPLKITFFVEILSGFYHFFKRSITLFQDITIISGRFSYHV